MLPVNCVLEIEHNAGVATAVIPVDLLQPFAASLTLDNVSNFGARLIWENSREWNESFIERYVQSAVEFAGATEGAVSSFRKIKLLPTGTQISIRGKYRREDQKLLIVVNRKILIFTDVETLPAGFKSGLDFYHAIADERIVDFGGSLTGKEFPTGMQFSALGQRFQSAQLAEMFASEVDPFSFIIRSPSEQNRRWFSKFRPGTGEHLLWHGDGDVMSYYRMNPQVIASRKGPASALDYVLRAIHGQ